MWCNISGGAGGEIWHWSLSGVKGLKRFAWTEKSLEQLQNTPPLQEFWFILLLNWYILLSKLEWIIHGHMTAHHSVLAKSEPHSPLNSNAARDLRRCDLIRCRVITWRWISTRREYIFLARKVILSGETMCYQTILIAGIKFVWIKSDVCVTYNPCLRK